MAENNLATRWREAEGTALYMYQRFLTKSARWHFEGKSNINKAKLSGRPILWTLWHAQIMAFIVYGDRFEGWENFCLVLAGDTRYDVLGTLANRFGAASYGVNMQGNPVASGRAVLRVIKAMKSGKHTMLAPDGPDGPPFVPKRGVAFLARKAKAVILPVGVWTRHAYQMRRWDRYMIPFPFAKMNMAIGEPIMAEPKMEEQMLLDTIAERLDATRTRAQEMSGITPWR